MNSEALQTLQTAPEALPQMWARLRGQWEYGHAVRFVLQLAGLSVLVWSVLSETPAIESATSGSPRAPARASQPAHP